MSRRRRVRGISNQTLLLVGGGAVLLYLIMKPKAPTLLSYGPTPAQLAQQQAAQSQSTASMVSSAASVANNLINSIFS